MSKTCCICKEKKDESEFHKHHNRRDGLASQCKLCAAAYYANNKSKLLSKQSEYYANNKDKIKEYYVVNKERIGKQNSEYYQANKVKMAAYQSKYQTAYSARRRKTDPVFKFKANTRSLIWHSLTRGGYKKKSKTATLLGCSYDQFMEWLGPKPCENPELDHICPVSQAKNEDEANRLQSYINFQWLTPEENLRKRDSKTPEGEALCLILLGREWE
jgi:hypothetical protein